MRYVFITVAILGLNFSFYTTSWAAPQWEVRSWNSPGRNYEGYYGFQFNRDAEQRCRNEESLVLDVLRLAEVRALNVRCQVTNLQKGGMTIEKVWVLGGTFEVRVE